MGTLAGIALAVTIYMIATGNGGGYAIIPILITIAAGFLYFVDECAKDEQAYRNRRNYWLKCGSGVRDRRTYDDRYKRRR